MDVDSHDFRHTKITELINSGMQLTDVQTYVGHSEAKTTLGYVKRKRNAEVINNII
jgi:integrase